MDLELGFGEYRQAVFRGKKGNQDIIGITYNILKNPQMPGEVVDDKNVGPEVLRLIMTPEYALYISEVLKQSVEALKDIKESEKAAVVEYHSIDELGQTS